ncbi:MAG: shikimate dehydrogenase family protein, partial [Alphaproteobacteria bacterium]
PADPAGHDLVVNATPMGMKPEDPFPLAVPNLTPAMTVMDIIMKPRETALLARAREIGCPVQYGAAMTDSQMDLWTSFLGLRGAKA